MLKPVEILTMLPRSLDVQKVQEINHNRPNLDGQAFANAMTQQYHEHQIQVPANEASNTSNTIHRDLSENGKRRNPQKDRSHDQKKTAETEEVIDTGRGHHIDLTV